MTTTDEAVCAFREAHPYRTYEEEIAFICEQASQWVGKPKWWKRRYLTKTERAWVALAELHASEEVLQAQASWRPEVGQAGRPGRPS